MVGSAQRKPIIIMELPEGLSQILAYILFFTVLGWFGVFSFRHGSGIVDDLKGSDKRWQPEEVIIIVWLFIFPVLVISDLFLNLEASDKVWYGMDLILLFALGGKGYRDNIRAKHRKEQNNEETI